MKILMVTMSMGIGGAETHILELCRELNRLGHDITLASFGGVYADELMSLGIRHVSLPMNKKDPISAASAYRGLYRLIRGGNFDIVHAHARIPAFICSLVRRRLDFRFVTTAHLNFSVSNPLWRRLSNWGDRSMAVSFDIEDYLVKEYGFPRERIYQTINGIDTNKFSASIPFDDILKKHSLIRERRRIVYISRLDSDRADPAFRLIEAAPDIHAEFPDTDILIVGGGNEFGILSQLASSANQKMQANVITMTGPASNINEYCAAADIVIAVSRSALEAMAAERPVILSGGQGALGIFDRSKIADSVDTNFCCRGKPLADRTALLGWIRTLLSARPDDLSEMGKFNRQFILEHYTAARMAEDYLAMYHAELRAPIGFSGDADVVLSGYYGFGNIGDESLLDVISGTISREIPGVKIAALTRKPRLDSRRTGLVCRSRFNIPVVYRTIRHSGLLISGGGSLLQDTTSRRSLKYYAAILGIAERAGIPSYIFANGVGPVTDPANRRIAARVVDRADFVSVRDNDSAAELKRLGAARTDIAVTADPAFLIKPYDERRLHRTLARIGAPEHYFAVSLRPLNDGGTPELPELMAKICTEISAALGLSPIVMPMQEAEDRAICERFCAAYRGSTPPVIYSPENAPECIAVLGRAAFLIGMRLHSIIFASSAETPVIGIVYDPKIESMMKSLDQSFIVHPNPAELQGISKMAMQIMENRREIAAGLHSRAAELRERCFADLENVRKILKK